MNAVQSAAGGVVLIFALVLGPVLIPGLELSNPVATRDGPDSATHEAMDEVLAAARKDSSVGFKVIRAAAMRCASGVDEWGETARVASAKAVVDVFSKSVTYIADPAHRDHTNFDVLRFLQKSMVAKVKALSKKGGNDPMTMAIGSQNIQFESTTRCVFKVAQDELKKQKKA